jgi:tetratricopeptide (TPR) repeat protein
MNEPHDPNGTVDHSSAPADSLSTTDDVAAAVSTEEALPDANAPGGDFPSVPGYRVLREIARGGMGRVLAAYDLTLDREVALKIQLPGANADRFVRESKITARLPHPGIPPVHALGTLADGSPFLAMKLIAGQTLAAEMKTADRPRLLQVITQVCQAVGFAHSRGVIHRDLKPANIMVGAFGEVQVMDWGLAKEVGKDERGPGRDEKETADGSSSSFIIPPSSLEPDPNRTTDYPAARDSTAERTQAGSVLGTPSYMAPEQARGEAADARADVFSLGGILCAVLTGQPPFGGPSKPEVIRRAGAADLGEAHARLGRCGADAELVALCRRCLNPGPADRPADGQAVAYELSSYLNGVQERLQAAERERAVAVAREAEQRKRRQVQLLLGAAVLALLLGGGAFAWWRNAQAQAGRERDARNAEAVAALLGQAEEALKAGDAAKAAVALEAAGKRSAEGGAEQEAERLGRLDADLALLRELDAIDRSRWAPTETGVAGPAAAAARTRAVLRQFGADPEAAPLDEAASRVSASAVRERIVTALHQVLATEKTAGVRALLRRVDANPYRDAVRDAILAGDGAQVLALSKQDAALEQPPGFVVFLSASEAITGERRRQLLEGAVSRSPGNVNLLMTLGNTYPVNQEAGSNDRLRWFQAAVAAAPTNPAPLTNLGNVLSDKGQFDKAIACHKKAIALDPKNAKAYNNLGNALALKGRLDEAIAPFEKAIALDPKYANAHYNLGLALKMKGQLDKAIACHKKAIALDPKNAKAYINLGSALADKGRWDEAIRCYTKAIALDPKLTHAYFGLGLARSFKGQWDEARSCYRKVTELDPLYAEAHCNLGFALARQGRFAESLTSLKRGHELGTKRPRWPWPSAQWVHQAEAKAALEAQLPAWRKGEFQPKDTAERLGLIEVCRAKQLHHAATRLYADAFAADSKLADDLKAQHRYNAACSAALAAAGRGEDATKLGDGERSRLRTQALSWLRADLVQCAKAMASGHRAGRDLVLTRLRNWQKDSDLAGLRDAAALAKLSAEDRTACEKLWADVAGLLKTAGQKAN